MITSFIRTLILLVAVIAALRLMGKRQIGQLQPAELVVTILLSQIAATPMQDNDIPLMNTLIAVMVLVGVEILISFFSLKSYRLRSVLQGNPVMVIREGKIDCRQLAKLRFTVDDLMESLRQKDVFDITDVAYAVAETDGSLSVLLRPGEQPATSSQIGAVPEDGDYPYIIISDGHINYSDFDAAGLTEEKFRRILKGFGVSSDGVFLMTVKKSGEVNLVRRENSGVSSGNGKKEKNG